MATTTSSTSAAWAARAGVTEQAADAAVEQACRMLRLLTMRAHGEVADSAQRERLTYRGFLAELLMPECDDRDRRRSPPDHRRRFPAGEVAHRLRLQRQPAHPARKGTPGG